MANTKISALAALTGSDVTASTDVLPIVDTSAATTKKILVSELAIAVAANLTAPTSWTPTIAFGGASVGITYALQSGSAVQIGKLALLSYTLILTNKGSSTGAATVSSLPIAATTASPMPISWGSMTGSFSSMTAISGALQAGIYGMTAADSTLSQLTQTAFSNNSVLQGMLLFQTV